MEGSNRVTVLGVPVDTVDMSSALGYIDNFIQNDKKGNYVLAVNPEKVISLKKDLFLKHMFENASLLVPDGIGVVLAIKLLYGIKITRVPGADLMQVICKVAAEKGYKIFIFGSKEEVNHKAVDKLKLTYQGIQIVGRCNGYVSADKMNDLIDKINKSNADILFVALGSPKQEQWIQNFLPKLNVKVCQGIGGTLDTIVGYAQRAPWFIQRLGMEWLYRLIKEPKRISRQIVYPVFVLKVIKERIGGKLKI